MFEEGDDDGKLFATELKNSTEFCADRAIIYDHSRKSQEMCGYVRTEARITFFSVDNTQNCL